MVYELKNIDNKTIKIEAKDITDDSIYELKGIKKTLDTYPIKKMTWFEYDYVPYYSIGRSREASTPTNNPYYKNYTDLLEKLLESSQYDRSHGWSNSINFLNIICELKEETVTSDDILDKKLDFICNLLFDIYCQDNYNMQYFAYKLVEAEKLGFNVEESKNWCYDEKQYEFYKKCNNEDK